MPEGDSLYRAAQRLQALVGERVSVEAPHPIAAAKGIAPRLDGKRIEAVEAVGKNLLLRFEGGLTLRSHLKMKGRWWVHPHGWNLGDGKPWLVLRGATHEAVLWHGPALELDDSVRRRLGPDILAEPPDFDAMLANLRALPQDTRLGEALQTQRAIAGVGNMWTAEALWDARLSPWLTLHETIDDELRTVLDSAARLMHESARGARTVKPVHRRAGRPCSRCGGTIGSRPLGDAARMAYCCPGCKAGFCLRVGAYTGFVGVLAQQNRRGFALRSARTPASPVCLRKRTEERARPRSNERRGFARAAPLPSAPRFLPRCVPRALR